MKGKLRSMQITLGVHIRNAKGVKFHGLLCSVATMQGAPCGCVSVGYYCRLRVCVCVCVWRVFAVTVWQRINSLTNLNGT